MKQELDESTENSSNINLSESLKEKCKKFVNLKELNIAFPKEINKISSEDIPLVFECRTIIEGKDISLVKKAISGLVKKLPNNSIAYLYSAYLHIKENNFDLAINDFTKAIELSPKDSFIYNKRGNAYYQKGIYDLALKDFEFAEMVAKNAKPIEFTQAKATQYNRSIFNQAYENDGKTLSHVSFTAQVTITNNNSKSNSQTR